MVGRSATRIRLRFAFGRGISAGSALPVWKAVGSSPLAMAAVSILMLTAKGKEVDQFVGRMVGADDYVTTPFSIRIPLCGSFARGPIQRHHQCSARRSGQGFLHLRPSA
jgi:hypothetical protein